MEMLIKISVGYYHTAHSMAIVYVLDQRDLSSLGRVWGLATGNIISR